MTRGAAAAAAEQALHENHTASCCRHTNSAMLVLSNKALPSISVHAPNQGANTQVRDENVTGKHKAHTQLHRQTGG